MQTFLTDAWQLRIPVIGAPMSPQAGGRLATAHLYAGQAVALATQVEPAAAILTRIAQEAEQRLRTACGLHRSGSTADEAVR